MIYEVAKGKYRHNKSGKIYEVIGVATHSETDEPLVIYRPLYDSQYELFARPYAMFFDEVENNGVKRPRFELIDEAKL